MDFNMFLDEDESYKYYILKLLELKQGTFISQPQLIEMLGISKYKLEKYMLDIEEDSRIIEMELSITVGIDGGLIAKGINNLIVKKLRLVYLEKSVLFKILNQLIVGNNNSVDDMAEKLHISRAKIYKELKSVKNILKAEDIKIKNLMLIGEEVIIRSFLFSFLNEFYCGFATPFSKKTNDKILRFKKILFAKKNIYPTKVQEYRLELFLGVAFTRNESGFYLRECILDDGEFDLYPYMKVLTSDVEKNREELYLEIQNIFLFCYTENMLDDEKNINLKIDTKVKRVADLFLKQMRTSFQLSELVISELRTELYRINRKWLYFHFKEVTFIFESQKSYFQEVYIKSDDFVRSFLENSELNELFCYEGEKVKVYYDYLFLVTTMIPVEVIEEPIYACIDFSHGFFYNEFIKKSIESFKNLNIVFEQKISTRTNVYISDFILESIVCEQIIWKNPPGPNDWKSFGDMVVKFKKGGER